MIPKPRISNDNRIEYIDLAKGICILLVVLFHVSLMYKVNSPIDTAVRSFRMPLYFILSGLFFKPYGGFLDFFKKKTNRLLIPFLFFYSISVIIMTFLFHYNFFETLVSFILKEDFTNSPIWFLFCLFEVNVLFYIFFMIANKTRHPGRLIVVGSLLAGVGGMLFSYYNLNLYAFLDSSLSVMPFFCFGWFIGRKTDYLKRPLSIKEGVIVFLLSIIVLALFSSPVLYRTNYFSERAYYTAYLCGIVGTIMVITISKSFMRIPLVSYWGRYSIIILCTHYYVNLLVYKMLGFWGLFGEIGMLLNWVFTMFIELLIIPFCIRFLPYVTAQKDLFS